MAVNHRRKWKYCNTNTIFSWVSPALCLAFLMLDCHRNDGVISCGGQQHRIATVNKMLHSPSWHTCTYHMLMVLMVLILLRSYLLKMLLHITHMRLTRSSSSINFWFTAVPLKSSACLWISASAVTEPSVLSGGWQGRTLCRQTGSLQGCHQIHGVRAWISHGLSCCMW